MKPIEPFLEGENKLVDNYMKQLSFVTKESTVEREKATNFYIQKYEKNHESVTPDYTKKIWRGYEKTTTWEQKCDDNHDIMIISCLSLGGVFQSI